MKISHISGSMIAITVMLAAGLASAQTTTLKGTVTDQMCGAHHMMAGASAQKCTRECVGMGSRLCADCRGQGIYAASQCPSEERALYPGRRDRGG